MIWSDSSNQPHMAQKKTKAHAILREAARTAHGDRAICLSKACFVWSPCFGYRTVVLLDIAFLWTANFFPAFYNESMTCSRDMHAGHLCEEYIYVTNQLFASTYFTHAGASWCRQPPPSPLVSTCLSRLPL